MDFGGFQTIDFFSDNGLYVDDSSELDVSALAKLLEVSQKELAKAFDISESHITRKQTTSDNKFVMQWMSVFNLLTTHIKETEPEISSQDLKLKMSRWLKMPSTHFSNQSPLVVMLQGRTRRVIKLIEQITA